MKVFVTIGSQDPFDRLIGIMDEIAAELGVTVVAQSMTSNASVKNIRVIQFLSPPEFGEYVQQADLIVSHAGIGTILTVLQLGKPLIVFPREGRFRETRDDHQVATVNAMSSLGYFESARTKDELKEKIVRLSEAGTKAERKIGESASPELMNSLEQFILS